MKKESTDLVISLQDKKELPEKERKEAGDLEVFRITPLSEAGKKWIKELAGKDPSSDIGEVVYLVRLDSLPDVLEHASVVEKLDVTLEVPFPVIDDEILENIRELSEDRIHFRHKPFSPRPAFGDFSGLN